MHLDVKINENIQIFDFSILIKLYTVCYRKAIAEIMSFSRSLVVAVIGEIECNLQLFC